MDALMIYPGTHQPYRAGDPSVPMLLMMYETISRMLIKKARCNNTRKHHSHTNSIGETHGKYQGTMPGK